MAEVCQDSEERSNVPDPHWIGAYQPGKRPVRGLTGSAVLVLWYSVTTKVVLLQNSSQKQTSIPI